MTEEYEVSYFWDGISPGDAVEAPYSAEVMAGLFQILFMSGAVSEGVIRLHESALEVTNPSGNLIRVPPGAALVTGTFYENDANVDTTISTPTLATRKDRVILRKTISEQTVLIDILTGTEGGGVPSLTQETDIWEIPLATITITTSATITITDERQYVISRLSDVSVTGTSIWELIETLESDGTEDTLTFQGDYTDFEYLLVMGSLKHSQGGELSETELSRLDLRINADTGGKYGLLFNAAWDSDAAAVTMVSGQNTTWQNSLDLQTILSANAPANAFGKVWILFHNPNDNDHFKNFEAMIGGIAAEHGDPSYCRVIQGTYQSTGIITRLDFFNGDYPSDAFTAGSKIQLYGIRE